MPCTLVTHTQLCPWGRSPPEPQNHLAGAGVLGAAQPQQTSPAQGRSGCCFLPDSSPRFPSIHIRGCQEEAALIIVNYCSRADSTRMSSAAPSPPSAMLHLPNDLRQPLSTPAPACPRSTGLQHCAQGIIRIPAPTLWVGKVDRAPEMRPKAPEYGREGHHHPEPTGTVSSLQRCLLRDALFISLNHRGAARTQSFPQTAQFS